MSFSSLRQTNQQCRHKICKNHIHLLRLWFLLPLIPQKVFKNYQFEFLSSIFIDFYLNWNFFGTLRFSFAKVFIRQLSETMASFCICAAIAGRPVLVSLWVFAMKTDTNSIWNQLLCPCWNIFAFFLSQLKTNLSSFRGSIDEMFYLCSIELSPRDPKCKYCLFWVIFKSILEFASNFSWKFKFSLYSLLFLPFCGLLT